MTQETKSAAIAMTAIEAARASMPPQEFTLYVTHFNFHYLLCRLSMSADFSDDDVAGFSASLAKPITKMIAAANEISEERNKELHDRAFDDVRAAIEAAAIDTSAPLQAVIDRAEKEGFAAPTMEQMVQAAKRQNVNWQAVVEVSERFHFQGIVKRIRDGSPLPTSYVLDVIADDQC